MSMRSTVFVSACAIAISGLTSPAFADGLDGLTNFDGVLTGDYSQSDAGHKDKTDVWEGTGTAAFGLGWQNLVGQIDGGYHDIEVKVPGASTDITDWNADGSIFWREHQGRLGLVVGYNSFDGSFSGVDAHLHLTDYGGFGELFIGPMFTFGLKAVGLTGSASASFGGFGGSVNLTGDVFGAAASVYAIPNLEFTGSFDYDHLKSVGISANADTWSLEGEWLVSEDAPVSIFGGYENTKVSDGGPKINTWFAGLRFYTDANGPAPLVERQRGGAATWGTSIGTAGLASVF